MKRTKLNLSPRDAVQFDALVSADEALHTLGLHVALDSRIRYEIDKLQTEHIHPAIYNLRDKAQGDRE